MSSLASRRRRRQLRDAMRCPDCNSIVRRGPGSNPRWQVRHDATCPRWRSRGAKTWTETLIAPPPAADAWALTTTEELVELLNKLGATKPSTGESST